MIKGMTGFNAKGYGVGTSRDIVIYHRWGTTEDWQLEGFLPKGMSLPAK